MSKASLHLTKFAVVLFALAAVMFARPGMACADTYAFSSYEYAPGAYLVTYEAPGPGPDVAAANYKGQEMYWLTDLQIWGTLVSENPQGLQASDFTQSGIAEERVLTKSNDHGNTAVVGDMNSNGVCNVVDAQIVYDMARGIYRFDSSSDVKLWLSADMNGDKALDSLDALAVQRIALGGVDALYPTTTDVSDCVHDYVPVKFTTFMV